MSIGEQNRAEATLFADIQVAIFAAIITFLGIGFYSHDWFVAITVSLVAAFVIMFHRHL